MNFQCIQSLASIPRWLMSFPEIPAHSKSSLWTMPSHGHNKGNWEYLDDVDETSPALVSSQPPKYRQNSLSFLLLLPKNRPSLSTWISSVYNHLLQFQDGPCLFLKSLHIPNHPPKTMDESYPSLGLQSGHIEIYLLDSLPNICKALMLQWQHNRIGMPPVQSPEVLYNL